MWDSGKVNHERIISANCRQKQRFLYSEVSVMMKDEGQDSELRQKGGTKTLFYVRAKEFNHQFQSSTYS
jgi:hypothetical protein